MRQRLLGWLSLVILAATISGCDLEFVSVELEGPSHLDLRVHTDSNQDSMRIVGELHRGFDEAGNRRSVLSGLQIDDEVLTPDMTENGNWEWDMSVPIDMIADGRLTIHLPLLEGLGSPQPVELGIPEHIGPSRLEVIPGEPIPLRFTLPPGAVYWRARLLDADSVVHYSAESRNLPSGLLVMPSDLLPVDAPGPYRAELDLVTDRSNELEAGPYSVRFLATGRLNWVIVRRD